VAATHRPLRVRKEAWTPYYAQEILQKSAVSRFVHDSSPANPKFKKNRNARPRETTNVSDDDGCPLWAGSLEATTTLLLLLPIEYIERRPTTVATEKKGRQNSARPVTPILKVSMQTYSTRFNNKQQATITIRRPFKR